MDRPTASEAEGRVFEPRLAPLCLSEFVCEISLVFYYELVGEGKYFEESCTFPQTNWIRKVR